MAGSSFDLTGSRIANATRTWQANEDVDVAGWDTANDFIFAAMIEATAHAGGSGDLQLRWRNQTDAGSFAVLSGAGELTWSGTTDLVNGNAVASGEEGCTPIDGSSLVDGVEREGANDVATTFAQNDYGEHHWAIGVANILAGKQYEFEIYDNTEGAAVGTCLAQITTTAGAVSVTVNIASEMTSTATMYADTTTADALFSVAAEMTATATMYADTVTADALFNVAAAMTSLATVYEETVTAESPDVTINIASEMTAIATMYADTTTADALFTIASEMTATAIMYADTITADALFNVSSEMASVATMYADTVTADALFNIAAEMTSVATMYADTTTADCDISVNVMTAAAAMNSASITGTALVQLSTMAATATVYAVTVTTGEGGEEIVFVHLPLIPHMPTIAPDAIRDDGVG